MKQTQSEVVSEETVEELRQLLTSKVSGDGLRGGDLRDAYFKYNARPIAPLGLTGADYRQFIKALLIMALVTTMVLIVV